MKIFIFRRGDFEMKKIFLVVAFVLLTVLLSACGSDSQVIPIPQDVKFEMESNDAYVGSYHIYRSNLGQEWSEYGEWTPVQYVLTLGGPEVCFGFDGHDGHFRATEGYKWTEVISDGRTCLKLTKIK